MRSTEDRNVPTVWFVEDLPKGGVKVECPCGRQIEQHGDQVPFAEYCPKCEEELVYPGWASW